MWTWDFYLYIEFRMLGITQGTLDVPSYFCMEELWTISTYTPSRCFKRYIALILLDRKIYLFYFKKKNPYFLSLLNFFPWGMLQFQLSTIRSYWFVSYCLEYGWSPEVEIYAYTASPEWNNAVLGVLSGRHTKIAYLLTKYNASMHRTYEQFAAWYGKSKIWKSARCSWKQPSSMPSKHCVHFLILLSFLYEQIVYLINSKFIFDLYPIVWLQFKIQSSRLLRQGSRNEAKPAS